jgi:hypothetical protein
MCVMPRGQPERWMGFRLTFVNRDRYNPRFVIFQREKKE